MTFSSHGITQSPLCLNHSESCYKMLFAHCPWSGTERDVVSQLTDAGLNCEPPAGERKSPPRRKRGRAKPGSLKLWATHRSAKGGGRAASKLRPARPSWPATLSFPADLGHAPWARHAEEAFSRGLSALWVLTSRHVLIYSFRKRILENTSPPSRRS